MRLAIANYRKGKKLLRTWEVHTHSGSSRSMRMNSRCQPGKNYPEITLAMYGK